MIIIGDNYNFFSYFYIKLLDILEMTKSRVTFSSISSPREHCEVTVTFDFSR